jgi:hypothetical protein
MNILGLEPVVATVIITFIGVGVQVGLGYLKNEGGWDGKKVAASGIIAVFSGFLIVAPLISALPENADMMAQFSAFIGAIAVVSGIDTITKHVFGAARAKK